MHGGFAQRGVEAHLAFSGPPLDHPRRRVLEAVRSQFGHNAGGQSFEELCEEGFLDMDGPHAASWSHRSAPHGGKGPEEVMWAPADGGGRVSVVDAATERPR